MRTFAGIPKEFSAYNNAKVVILPVPYDGTSTYGKGADKGPEALLDAAENMELFDIETQSEVYKNGIFLAPPVLENRSPEQMAKTVEETVKNHLQHQKFVGMIGGEHSVSIGAINAFQDEYNNLSVLQIDAHSDLRPSYNGTPFNHACAMHHASKTCNLVQVGIRSMDTVELPFLKKDKLFTSYRIRSEANWMDDVVSQLGKQVYITIDLDAFDPAIMPATGTPEPGGLLWNESLDLLKKVFQNHEVVGFDIVELAPINGFSAPDFMAAKLLYKILSYKFHLS